jgi:hypothetical protein
MLYVEVGEAEPGEVKQSQIGPKLATVCHLVLNSKTFILMIWLHVGITYHIFYLYFVIIH